MSMPKCQNKFSIFYIQSKEKRETKSEIKFKIELVEGVSEIDS